MNNKTERYQPHIHQLGYSDCCGSWAVEDELDNLPTCMICKSACRLIIDELPQFINTQDFDEFLDILNFKE